MIVEGYDLNLYCDGKHTDWEMTWGKTEATAGFGGRGKQAAWRSARREGWTKIRSRVYCPECSAERAAKRKS
jgi:hypothetical protein